MSEKTRAKSAAFATTGRSGADADPLCEGQPIPDFSLPLATGGSIAPSSFKGRQLVVFFFPKADTPGCTQEAADFQNLAGEFASAGTALLGVSADPIPKLQKFAAKHLLSIPLASDEALSILPALGVWAEKSMYGKRFMGILRTTVLVGSDGRILHTWHNVRVKGHVEAVLSAAREALIAS